MLCVYIIFFMLGVSEYIILIVWWIDDGVGFQWLMCDVKCGDYFWFLDAMGEFICDDKVEDKFLLLVVGCGVMSIMSMCRWFVKNCLQVDVWVIYNVCMSQDVIFVDEWCNYLVMLVVENNVIEGFIVGRFIRELLVGVFDLVLCIVMICGLVLYMDWVEQEVKVFGVMCFFKEKFFILVVEVAISGLKFIKL